MVSDGFLSGWGQRLAPSTFKFRPRSRVVNRSGNLHIAVLPEPQHVRPGAGPSYPLAYAITIHKSQGSEFHVVVTPLAMQQYMLLQRNLVYSRQLVMDRQAHVVLMALMVQRPGQSVTHEMALAGRNLPTALDINKKAL